MLTGRRTFLGPGRANGRTGAGKGRGGPAPPRAVINRARTVAAVQRGAGERSDLGEAPAVPAGKDARPHRVPPQRKDKNRSKRAKPHPEVTPHHSGAGFDGIFPLKCINKGNWKRASLHIPPAWGAAHHGAPQNPARGVPRGGHPALPSPQPLSGRCSRRWVPAATRDPSWGCCQRRPRPSSPPCRAAAGR